MVKELSMNQKVYHLIHKILILGNPVPHFHKLFLQGPFHYLSFHLHLGLLSGLFPFSFLDQNCLHIFWFLPYVPYLYFLPTLPYFIHPNNIRW